MDKIIFLLIAFSFVSCNKELELTSCDLKVYYTSNKDGDTLDKLSNEIYISKGWNIIPIKINKYSEIDRREQHAVLSRSGYYKALGSNKVNSLGQGYGNVLYSGTRISKNEVTCLNELSFGFPQLGKKDKVQNKTSYITGYRNFYSRLEAEDFVEGRCESSTEEMIPKIPSCKLK